MNQTEKINQAISNIYNHAEANFYAPIFVFDEGDTVYQLKEIDQIREWAESDCNDNFGGDVEAWKTNIIGCITNDPKVSLTQAYARKLADAIGAENIDHKKWISARPEQKYQFAERGFNKIECPKNLKDKVIDDFIFMADCGF